MVVLVSGYFAWALHTVPTAEAALRKSLSTIGRPGLSVAVALHPDYCSIEGSPGFRWRVECIGVPMHHYTDVTICGPVTPEECAPAPSTWTDCTSFWWNIDAWGQPSNPNGARGKFASMGENCREKATYDADREAMRQRGLSAAKMKMYDFTGNWSSKR